MELSYCISVYKYQGETVEGNVLIHDFMRLQ